MIKQQRKQSTQFASTATLPTIQADYHAIIKKKMYVQYIVKVLEYVCRI